MPKMLASGWCIEHRAHWGGRPVFVQQRCFCCAGKPAYAAQEHASWATSLSHRALTDLLNFLVLTG